ncbi:MAG: hypothetical protein CVV45_14960 [Spirochaetae bacterium HGW-Spirochaetae-10]|nr:MAG: hypothetical protein CVV45_14960 [Spirochaetae bacterium HGW-Spirochaetae-10]
MKKRVLLFAMLAGLSLQSAEARDLSETLKSLAPSLMTSRHVPGLQIVVFRPGRELALSFGTTGETDVTDDTLFFTGELSTALLPLLLEEEMRKETLSIREGFTSHDQALLIYARFQESIHRPGNLMQMPVDTRRGPLRGKEIFEGLNVDRAFLLNLYHSVSGLPPSRSGIASSAIDPAILSKSLAADETPYSRIAFSSEGMQLLLDYLASVRGQTIEEMLSQTMRNQGMKRSLIVSGSPESYEKLLEKASDGYTSEERPVKIRHPHIVYPGIYGMVSNARDVATLLKELAGRAATTSEEGSEDLPFGSYFTYDPSLGGVSGPFHARRLCSAKDEALVVYEQSSRFPGFASYVLFSPDGRGMALLANADDMALLHRLSERILLDLFTECSPPENDRLQANGEWNATLLSWFGGDATRLEAYLHKIEGTYRPEGILPRKRENFAFMGDVRVRLNSEHRLEIAGFYDREIPIFLVPDTEPFVFKATGRAAMSGWKVKFIEQKEGEGMNIVGFYTDQVAYQRVMWGDSIWGRIVGFAFTIFVFALLVLLIYLRKRNYIKSGQNG